MGGVDRFVYMPTFMQGAKCVKRMTRGMPKNVTKVPRSVTFKLLLGDPDDESVKNATGQINSLRKLTASTRGQALLASGVIGLLALAAMNKTLQHWVIVLAAVACSGLVAFGVWKRTKSVVGALVAAIGPIIFTVWHAAIALGLMDGTESSPATYLTIAAVVAAAIIFSSAVFVDSPKDQEPGSAVRIGVDNISLRWMLDGAVVAAAAITAHTFFAPASIWEANLFGPTSSWATEGANSGAGTLRSTATFITLAALAGRPIAKLTRTDPLGRVGGSVVLLGLVGMSFVYLRSESSGIGGQIGFALAAMAIVAFATVPAIEAQKTRTKQRAYEIDTLLPAGSLLGVWMLVGLFSSYAVGSDIGVFLLSGGMALQLLRLLVSWRISQDVTDEIDRMAFLDSLTGLPNRASLTEDLTEDNGWIMLFELDGFDQINDQFGHEAGDGVLLDMVDRIEAILTPEAKLYRVGGPQFAVTVPPAMQDARTLSRKVVRHGCDPTHSQVSVSLGLGPYGDGKTPTQAMRGADIALQEAKRAGRNHTAILEDSMLTTRMRELQIAWRLRSGGLDDIFVAYQPMVALGWQGAPVIAVEALARWHDRELGAVSPAEFVPVAERQGMVPMLGLIVLRKSLEQLRIWIDQGTPVQVSINVSALQLRDDFVVEEMQTLLAVEPELAKWIILEVSESLFNGEDDMAVKALHDLRSLGLCTAIDDLGAGSATLARMKSMPVDVLKVDRSLIVGAGKDESSDAILDMVSKLARRLGTVLVAEGLEDEMTAEWVSQMGYAVGQGYLYSQPVPASLLPDFAPLDRPALPRRATLEYIGDAEERERQQQEREDSEAAQESESAAAH